MIKYKDKDGKIFKFLAAGIYEKGLDVEAVVVYCPEDNENLIMIMGEKEFYQKFKIVMGERWKHQ